MTDVIKIRPLAGLTAADRATLLCRSETDVEKYRLTVREIISAVLLKGDKAVLEYSERFDGAKMKAGDLLVKPAEFAAARGKVKKDVREAIAAAVRNIRVYHERQMPQMFTMTEVSPGIFAGEKISPVASCGLYVPRGKGSFPSVMVMLGVPAVVAGIDEDKLFAFSPPDKNGLADPATLVAAQECGVKNVFKVGGVQAIAAMALGKAASIPKVDKIVGPGNAYVSAAKRELYGSVDVGLPAGPSESIILADSSTDPRLAAVDLLVEAEHGPDSCALLVTDSKPLAAKVKTIALSLIEQLPEPRKSFCRSGFSKYGGIILTQSRDESIKFVNEFAPEHLEILLNSPFDALAEINNAGEILIGKNTPITAGNYCLGIDAILPTGGFARSYSGVSVFDFLKRSSVAYATENGFGSIASTALTLAQYEGFPAHARAISERMPQTKTQKKR